MRVAAFHAGRHLDNVDLGVELTACPICGDATRTTVGCAQAEPDVFLLRCNRCQAVSVSRLPTERALDDYYDSYFTTDREHAVTADDPNRLGRRIARHVPAARSLSVLDFGGGDGSIGMATFRAARRSGSLTVVDYDHRRVAPSMPAVTIEFERELADVAGREYDVVIASAVLEHLPRPLPVLETLIGLVRTGGTFYARTPYVLPVLRAARRVQVSIDFTFPAHLHDLGQPFWDHLRDWYQPAAAFEVLASRPSPVETGMLAHPGRTITAYVLKAPWRVLRNHWPFVGGWEYVITRP